MSTEERYTAVMAKFTAAELLALPEGVKQILKETNDLETKVKLFEAIADIMNK